MFQILAPDGTVKDKYYLENISSDVLLEIYKLMVLVRLFEERGTQEAHLNHMPLYVSPRGQEAAEVASAYALGEQDWAFFYARYHGVALTRGVSPESIFKFLYGIFDKEAISDFLAHKVMPPYILVGIYLTHASGLSWSRKILGESPFVCVAYFGDGATAQDDFHSALNFSSIFKIPVVFICENNQYAISTPNNLQTATKTFAEKAAAYNMQSMLVDGNDPLAMYIVTQRAVRQAVFPGVPTLIEAVTYRLDDHTTAIGAISQPPKEEYEKALENEPLVRMKFFILSKEAKEIGVNWSEEDDRNFKEKTYQDIKEASRRVLACSEELIKSTPQEIMRGCLELNSRTAVDKKYFPDKTRGAFLPEIISDATGRIALNFAYYDIMSSDSRVVTLGEDVGKIGGVYRIVALPKNFVENHLPEKYKELVLNNFLPLINIFGESRCIDTPLDEPGIVGHAIGLAMGGVRPIVEIQFSGFVFETFGQIVTELARLFYNHGGLMPMPVVIRLPFGGGKFVEHHRESEIAFFMNSPGLTIVCPSTVQDFYDMLWASVASDKPVLFFEDKNLYRDLIKGDLIRRMPEKTIESFGIRTALEGKNVTVLSYGRLVCSCLKAAEILSKEKISVEVLDARVLAPLDRDTLISSVKKTGRLIIVQEEPVFGGTGAEFAASIFESEAFLHLEAPLVRLGPPRTYFPPLPFWKAYEPQPEEIAEAIRKTVKF